MDTPPSLGAIAPTQALPRPAGVAGKTESALMQKAKELEASFLSEMLGYAGLGASDGAFGGGIGEAQFASFLRDAEAKQLVAHGGIGLAEQLFHAMSKGQDHAD